ncbi:hypothetical protein NG800_001445 [Epilithonimonas ginsengisoli]|uniref:Uncharacterized protein n=1 Tax=Epilithonimonas ginsengisoli TaxID=1245592 RepID=A0ABU4JD18_9FLAO|nr:MULTISPECIES: hypothetical protein [Chryseobacterium group]MDW8547555.1 hypothetical protein [Epilithonimonas ginsengisoli]
MKLNIILCLQFILLFTASCNGQSTDKSEKDIYNIGNEIEHFKKEPHYGASITTNNCSFEILINDHPVIKYKDNSGGGLSGSYFPLNWDITQKGPQKITIRLSPGFNQNTKSMHPTLMKNSGVQINIVKSLIDKDNSWGDEEEVKNYITPQKMVEGKEVSTFDGKNYFEDSFTFEANVPYKINTLENAEVLFTTDKDKLKALEKEVVTKYNEVRDIYMKGTKDDLANIHYDKEKRLAQQMYLSSEEIKNSWDNDYQFRTNPDLEFFDLKPIEKYKITFYNKGKLVSLEKLNNEKSALWGGFKKKGNDIGTTTYIQLYLYRPKAGNGLKLY